LTPGEHVKTLLTPSKLALQPTAGGASRRRAER
jgi:hypothetical protein